MSTMIAEWARRQIVTPVVALLRQGATPEKLALSLALGIALGVFPVLGYNHRVVRDCRTRIAAEFASHSDRQLRRLSRADRSADSFFSLR